MKNVRIKVDKSTCYAKHGCHYSNSIEEAVEEAKQFVIQNSLNGKTAFAYVYFYGDILEASVLVKSKVTGKYTKEGYSIPVMEEVYDISYSCYDPSFRQYVDAALALLK